MISAMLKPRVSDSYGAGHFGAPRGERTHNGIDYAAEPGAAILAPVSGIVTKLGYPYADDLAFRYVEVLDAHGMQHRVFYIKPTVRKGDEVKAKITVIGYAQDLTKRYPKDDDHPEGIINHVHYEIRNAMRIYIDPIKYFTSTEAS